MPRKLDPEPRRRSTKGGTKLAVHRLRDGLTQQQMSQYTGIPIATYQRTERGERIPTIPELSNCATTLGVPLEDLIEDAWREWAVLDDRASKPPDHWRWWHKRGKMPDDKLEDLPPPIREALRREHGRER